jgi:hypothetical protein
MSSGSRKRPEKPEGLQFGYPPVQPVDESGTNTPETLKGFNKTTP